MLAVGCLAVVPMACLVGCDDGGDSGGGGEAPTVDVTGFWEGTCNAGSTFAFNLTQDADGNVTGDAGTGGSHGNVTGTVGGNTFTFSITFGETGTATVEGNVMTVTATPDQYSVVCKKK
jgi:hypothetical protein